MRKLFLFTAACLFSQILFSQTTVKKDPEIEKMVSEVSKDSLKSYDLKLVSFGTRNTLSTQTNPNRGIGAAREWVLSKFNEFAKQSEGRLTAFIDTTIQKKDGRRVDREFGQVGLRRDSQTA